MKKITYYAVCGVESGEIQEFPKEYITLNELKKIIKELKKFDKEADIEDVYYIEERDYTYNN